MLLLQVLDDGKIQQFGSPYDLLRDENGLFYQMVQYTGSCYLELLRRLAKKPIEDNTKNRTEPATGDAVRDEGIGQHYLVTRL